MPARLSPPESPRSLPHDYRIPPNARLATYPLDSPFTVPQKKTRSVRPKQLVVASLVGDVEAGHTYLVVVPKSVLDDEFACAGIYKALARFGARFTPPVDFYVFPEGTPIADVTGMDTRSAVTPCSAEARRPEIVAYSPIVAKARRRLARDA